MCASSFSITEASSCFAEPCVYTRKRRFAEVRPSKRPNRFIRFGRGITVQIVAEVSAPARAILCGVAQGLCDRWAASSRLPRKAYTAQLLADSRIPIEVPTCTKMNSWCIHRAQYDPLRAH